MKKLLAAITALVLLLAGCGGPAAQTQAPTGPPADVPWFSIAGDAYDCTPDELVLALREAIASVENLTFIPEEIPLPSETETDVLGDYRLIIVPRRLFLDLGVEDDGRVGDISVRWSGGSQDSDNAAVIIFCLLHMFMPDDIEKTVQDMDYAIIDLTSLEKTGNGSYLHYMYSEKVGNWMELRPSVESKAE